MNITLYAYLNIENPMVAWEVAIGRIKSICDNNTDNFGISLWQYSLMSRYVAEGLSNNFINELKLEKVRQGEFSDKVSRLRGVYFFESENDAHVALERWGMPEKIKYISAVNFSTNQLTRVDSEWITNCLLGEDDLWMRDYWAGKPYGIKPLNEILASGIGLVQNNDLRISAYESIIKNWPDSTPLLAAACCAFKVVKMEEVAMMRPALLISGSDLLGRHYLYMKDFDDNETEIVDAVTICKRNNEYPPVIMPSDGKTIFALPDMRFKDFKFSNVVAPDLFKSINNLRRDNGAR